MTQPWWSSPGPATNKVFNNAEAYISPQSSAASRSPDQIEVAFRRIAESGGGSSMRWGEVMDKYRNERELSPTRSPYRANQSDDSQHVYQGSVTVRMNQTPPPPSHNNQSSMSFTSNGYPPSPQHPSDVSGQEFHRQVTHQPPAMSQPPPQQYQNTQQHQEHLYYQQGPPPPPAPPVGNQYATQEALEKAEQRAVNLERQVQDLYRLLAAKDKAVESNSRPPSPQLTPERPTHATRIPDDPTTKDYPISPVYKRPIHPSKMSHQSLNQKYRDSDLGNLIPPYRSTHRDQREDLKDENRERGRDGYYRQERDRRDSSAGFRRTSSLRSRSSGQQQQRPVKISRTRSSSLHKRPPVMPEYDHEEIARNRAQRVAYRRSSLGKDKNFNYGKHLVSVGNIESHYSSRWADSLRNKKGSSSRPQWNANLKRDIGWQRINEYDREFINKQQEEREDYPDEDFEDEGVTYY